ncbi:MAG: sulfide/dihydroorotate dehydrogenase-like FAD/NAD-binding protein [Actinobacteria bacterium]|nr:sulfide/dihydroorotate dehydrogenase-like FAD/NAD-binding protein [Actinomycetota bacterium]
MFEILRKKQISPEGFLIRIKAPQVAQTARPGQFLILRVSETGERIPLTIVNWSRSRGYIDIAFQVVGKTTYLLSKLKEGDAIIDLIGPLGNPSKIERYGTVAFLAGGFGAAAVLPIARAMRKKGNRVLTVLGARSKNYLIFEKELKKTSDVLIITTDDGSKGIRGFVKDGLSEILNSEKIDIAYCIGPAVMMKFTSEETRKHSIPTIVSLNPIMVDGTGMCGSCRVEVGGKTYFACVDGPEFDAHLVNWDLLLSRLNYYKDEEKLAYESILKQR